MPAFVKRRFGLSGMRLEEGTMVCCFDLKKSRNDWRISLLVINVRMVRVASGGWSRPESPLTPALSEGRGRRTRLRERENSRRSDQMPNTKWRREKRKSHREHRGTGTEGTERGRVSWKYRQGKFGEILEISFGCCGSFGRILALSEWNAPLESVGHFGANVD